MKKTIKLFKATAVVAMATCLALSGVACGGRGDEEKIDTKKSQLSIQSWNGDFHLTWLEKIAERFEEEYKDYSFENGKEGVQVFVNPGSVVYDSFTTSIATMEEEIFVGEQMNYYLFVNKDTAMDISDVVTTPLTEYGESKSIVDKLTDDMWDFYGVGDSEDKTERTYYGLPWYETYPGFFYDKQLFEDEKLYLAAEGEGRDGFIINAKTKKGTGPDGEFGTIDDGLPATYEDFFKLLDKMYALDMEPVAWGGNAQIYLNATLSALAADYEGYNSMMTNYTLSGDTQIVSKINSDGTIELEDLSVSKENGYQLYQQAGFYYGLQFLERLIATQDEFGAPKYYDPMHSMSSSYTHRAVQNTFLRGGYVSDVKTRIGILLDSSWWYSGAEETFKNMSSIPGGSSLERNIGMMPMPKVDSDHLGEATYFDNWMSNIVVRKGIDESKVPLVNQFIRFMHTDKSLSEFTRLTSAVRPFVYDLTTEDEALTSEFGKQMLSIHGNSKIVHPWSKNELVINNLGAFMLNESRYTTITGGSFNIVSSALKDGVTAKQYFEGFKKSFSQSNWNSSYSKYFD